MTRLAWRAIFRGLKGGVKGESGGVTIKTRFFTLLLLASCRPQVGASYSSRPN
jgi:hypothetical protein